MRPLAIDLYCGLGGWSEGLIAEGYDVVGFDIERHEYAVPEIVDAREDGKKGTNPVAKRGWSQGCAISLGMEGAGQRPRTRLLRYPGQLVVQDVLTLHGRQFKDAALIVASPPCQEYSYMAMPWKRAKAKAAAIRADTTGRMLADLNRLFEACFRIQMEASIAAGRHVPMVVENVRGAIPWVGRSRWNFGSFHLWGDVPALMPWTASARKSLVACTGKRFDERVATSEEEAAAFHYKLPGFRFDGSGRSFQTAAVGEHIKQGGTWWHDEGSISRTTGSASPARKAASAMIAKIPLPLARHIAAVYKPQSARI